MSHSRTLVVCADDYALTPGVSRSIRELIDIGAISATSVMTVSRHWASEAAALAPLAARADIGLHLTLTDHTPLGTMPSLAPDGRLPPIGSLLRSSLLGRLDRVEVEAEIRRQLEAFVAHWGRPPDHVDGHHHVHQLPGVRGPLLDVLAELPPDVRPYLRCCAEPLHRVLARGIAPAKALLISALGAGLNRSARARGITTNEGFSGVYDFARRDLPVSQVFERMLATAGPRPLMMCHPGHVDDELGCLDPVVAPRAAEHAFLVGPEWPRLVSEAGFSIARFRTAKCSSVTFASAK